LNKGIKCGGSFAVAGRIRMSSIGVVSDMALVLILSRLEVSDWIRTATAARRAMRTLADPSATECGEGVCVTHRRSQPCRSAEWHSRALHLSAICGVPGLRSLQPWQYSTKSVRGNTAFFKNLHEVLVGEVKDDLRRIASGIDNECGIDHYILRFGFG